MHKDWKAIETTDELVKRLAANCCADNALESDIADVVERAMQLARKPLEDELGHCNQVRNDTMLELERVETKNEELRQQLAEKSAESDRRLALMNTLDADNDALSGQLAAAKFARRQAETDLSDCKNTLVAANAEIERLKEEVRVTKEEDFPRKVKAVANNWQNKLAASQLREQQLREALQIAADVQALSHNVRNAAISALTQPTDTTALEAMIAKAGEVMQIRAENVATCNGQRRTAEAIRALPGVTLEDLK